MEGRDIKLNNILETSPQYGFTASATSKKTGVQMLRITDIQNGSVDWSAVPFCEISKNKENKYLLQKYDIVFARTGATTGKTFLITDDLKNKIVFASYLIRVRPNKSVLPEYLYHFFQSQRYWSQIVTRGGIKPNFNASKLKNIEITLPFDSDGKPDLAEQKRIADKLDKVFAEVEKGTNTLSKNAQYANKVGASAMRQLLTTAKLGEIELGKVLNLQNGRAFKETDWSTKGLPIVRIQNLNNPEARFNHYEPKVEERFLIDSGDLLISWSGTPGTSFGAFIWQRGKAILNQHIFNAVPTSDKFSKGYLKYAVGEKLDEMILNSHGGVGLQHITKTDLVKVKLPIPLKDGEPDLERQESIADELDKMFSYSKNLSLTIEKQRQAFSSLRSSVLNQSFQLQT